MASLLWIIAVVLVVLGVVALLRGQVVAGVALIIVGLLVVPGGVSLFAWPGRNGRAAVVPPQPAQPSHRGEPPLPIPRPCQFRCRCQSIGTAPAGPGTGWFTGWLSGGA